MNSTGLLLLLKSCIEWQSCSFSTAASHPPMPSWPSWLLLRCLAIGKPGVMLDCFG